MRILNKTAGVINWFKTKHNIENDEAQKIIALYKKNNPLKLGQVYIKKLTYEKDNEYNKQFNRMCSWFCNNKESILKEIRN